MARQLRPGYRVDRLGTPMLDADGDRTGNSLGRVDALIKDHNPANFEIVNEYIAARLAAAIGLPVPPGDFAEIRDSEKLCWVSPLFAKESPPPPDIEELCAKEPRAAAGAIVFDSWIANQDRREFNILYTARHGVALIDHGQSLFYKGDDPERALKTAEATTLTSHILAPHADRSLVDEWCNTVSSVPKRMITGAVNPVQRLGLITSGHAKATIEFLETRARRIKQLIRQLDFPDHELTNADVLALDTSDGGTS